MKKFVLIAAGGSGNRMNASVPKQFLELHGKPLIFYTFQRFLQYAPDMDFVLVIPDSHHDSWIDLCQQHQFHTHHQIVSGGPTRFHSVKNGLRHIPDDCLVAIHDGVRPLVDLQTIARVFSMAAKFGNAIPTVEVNESVRFVEGAISKAVDRLTLRVVQTPQCFRAAGIKNAYNKNYHTSFTDDATVYEANGNRLFLVEGSPENIKITRPSDMIFANALIRQ